MNDIIEIAKDVILKCNKKNKSMPLAELWKKTAAIAKIKNIDDDDMISDFYLMLLEDSNFIKLANNEWTLKQFYSFSEVEKMSNNIFKTDEFEINEGDYDKFMSKYELNEMNHKYRNSDTAALDIDDFDDDYSDDDGREERNSNNDNIDDSDYDE